ncbi:MAG: hypothetical protein GEV06_11405 [Luteitalea sp.]|nr:hypothetical protein [Luteitalea sp.]
MSDVPFPEWVEPMAATLTQERFAGPEWLFERKFDGVRLLVFKRGAEIRLLSRNRLPQTIPALLEAVQGLPVDDLILDGEVTWGRDGLAYHLFDVMWLDGRDVMSLPLDARLALLSGLPLQPPLERVRPLEDPKPWERACREGWEGVIAKRRDSPYEQRRSRHWLKMKCEATQDLVVGGFTDPQGTRVGLGALLVGYFEHEDFVFAGRIGTGFDTKLLLELRARLDGLEIAKPLVDDLRSLLWLVNQNCITPHVWTSRAPDLYQPDLCVFDLDPSKDQPDILRAAALQLRDLLSELGLESWVKTSGSKGFHIIVPLDGGAGFGDVSRFAHAVGAILVGRDPEHLTQEFSKADRRGRILVDTGPNAYSATFAATYAVRTQPNAPVSAPCTWEELERGDVRPRTFTLRTMAERVGKVGDIWSAMRAQSLRAAIERLKAADGS